MKKYKFKIGYAYQHIGFSDRFQSLTGQPLWWSTKEEAEEGGRNRYLEDYQLVKVLLEPDPEAFRGYRIKTVTRI